MLAEAMVINDHMNWLVSRWVWGITNVWLARINDTITRHPPPSPKMPKPGKTKISNSRKLTPATNNITSSQFALPPR